MFAASRLRHKRLQRLSGYKTLISPPGQGKHIDSTVRLANISAGTTQTGCHVLQHVVACREA